MNCVRFACPPSKTTKQWPTSWLKWARNLVPTWRERGRHEFDLRAAGHGPAIRISAEQPVFLLENSTLTNKNNSRVVSGMRPGTEIVPDKSSQNVHIYSEG